MEKMGKEKRFGKWWNRKKVDKIRPEWKTWPAENLEDLEKEENPVEEHLVGGSNANKKEDKGLLASKNLLLENYLEDNIYNYKFMFGT